MRVTRSRAGRRSVMAAMAAAVLLALAAEAAAHEAQPGVLEIAQIGAHRYQVTWRAPLYFGGPHPAQVALPEEWRTEGEPTERRLPDSIVYQRVVTTGRASLDGTAIAFPGLEETITDVFVRLKRLDGTTFTAIAQPMRPAVELRSERAWYATAGEYLALGYHHILLGLDHLLFVLGLLLIVRGGTMLLKTITAFTVAHSLTLAIATLGWASAPLPPLNAAIALSILFLGPEIVRSWRGESSFTIRNPWVVAFAFGLLHGFGFATGLSTTGMPRAELPWALLWFNVGVEIGQLTFVGLALVLARSFRVLEMRWPVWIAHAPGYAVGVCGAYWTIQRTVMLFGGLQ